ncbi:DUF1810 domain-containing protein [Bifidobacterium callimiconis]|uniref:Calpastatin n=1 Tax=Bifidobacterium callimiconis TaxID=2306973 RepID=A0A430FC30_9BIFI|nr:DUF1810 domain-containing protein [Bifidobacterium callimiconis]MBT1177683.1 DUF1810 domain-containing protein [Bifidobacterium callimiconis]RSX50358.1 calpastatin [Bifidobacterium callimiconis]
MNDESMNAESAGSGASHVSAAPEEASPAAAASAVSESTPPADPDLWNLQRFVDAQRHSYATALSEVRAGAKRSHWIWYVFPQIQGLGRSSTSQYYAITCLDEAKAYLVHPVLGPRLIRITQAALDATAPTATAVFGRPDDMKLRSCMTLFALADPDQPVFDAVLAKWFGGHPDRRTLSILGR